MGLGYFQLLPVRAYNIMHMDYFQLFIASETYKIYGCIVLSIVYSYRVHCIIMDRGYFQLSPEAYRIMGMGYFQLSPEAYSIMDAGYFQLLPFKAYNVCGSGLLSASDQS